MNLAIEGHIAECTFRDTSGQEQYHALALSRYVRDVDGIIVVYDVTNRASFDALRAWVKGVKENMPSDALIIIIGNKSDLSDRVISVEEGRAFAESEKLLHFDTSAKDGAHVRKAFRALLATIVQRRKLHPIVAQPPKTVDIGAPSVWRRVWRWPC
jgi:small GTP-binding protein